MKRYDVINTLLRARRPATYLEIGLARGDCWFRVRAERKIGVEPRDVFASAKVTGPRKLLFHLSQWRGAQIYAMTSDEFWQQTALEVFSEHAIDVAFIDGWHSYEQSLRDVQNCLPWLAQRGVIVLHDCNPMTEAATAPTPAEALALSGGRSGWNGDVWKTIVHLRSLREDVGVRVLDCDEGLGLVWRGRAARLLPFGQADIVSMAYADLAANRVELLNLHPMSDDVLREHVLVN